MAQHSHSLTEQGGTAHGETFEQHHPTWQTYVKVGVLLTIITAIEVSAYYIPAWESSRIYVPSMLIMSAFKFAVVVMFYMHLKYDHKIFRVLFTGPFIIAAITLVALLFLFGQLAVRLGMMA
jgi:cytochrome c oxidase subunit 4